MKKHGINPVFFLLTLFAVLAAPFLASPAYCADAGLEPGAYECKQNGNPGVFVLAHDGTGLFATEEYISYFNWKTEGKKLLMTFLKGRNDDKSLEMAISGPDAFKFEKFSYSRKKGARLEKYKLARDGHDGSLLLLVNEKASAKKKAFMYLSVRDNNKDKFCEIELSCTDDGGNYACRDYYKARKKGGVITIKNPGGDELELDSGISGSHNYQKQCDYSGKYKKVK